ncbi:MAG: hypothetical protein JNG84_13765, partial [Archangium sp.]|nr:hypothetical protein [Archangium sp.]
MTLVARHVSLVLALLAVVGAGRASAQPSVKIPVDAGWATPLSPDAGDPRKLLDEQDTAGDLAGGARPHVTSNWGVTGGARPISAQIDLQRPHVITQVWMYDFNGTLPLGDAGYQVIANLNDGGTTVLAEDWLGAYQTWKQWSHNPGVTARFLTVKNPASTVGMPELVFYGYPVNLAPTMVAVSNGSTQSGTALVVPLSAADPERDPVAFSFVGTQPASILVATTNNGVASGTAAGTVTIGASTPVGTYPITVRASATGGSADRSFTVQVIAPPPVDAGTPTDGGTGTQTAIPTGLIPGSTWQTHLGYQEYVPAGYNAGDPSVKYPIVFFFHGYGGRGTGTVTELAKLTNASANIAPPRMLATGALQPMLPEKAIVLSPQTNDPYWYGHASAAFIKFALTKYASKVNPSKIYLTGLSLGGGGVWDSGNDLPGSVANIVYVRQQIAALLAVCGQSAITNENDPAKHYRQLRGIPVWAHHGTLDPNTSSTVPYARTVFKMKQLALFGSSEVNPETNRP